MDNKNHFFISLFDEYTKFYSQNLKGTEPTDDFIKVIEMIKKIKPEMTFELHDYRIN